MGLDDQCIDNGGVWCTLDAAWSDETSRLLLIVMLMCLMALVFMVATRVLKGVRDFKESRKGDL